MAYSILILLSFIPPVTVLFKVSNLENATRIQETAPKMIQDLDAAYRDGDRSLERRA